MSELSNLEVITKSVFLQISNAKKLLKVLNTLPNTRDIELHKAAIINSINEVFRTSSYIITDTSLRYFEVDMDEVEEGYSMATLELSQLDADFEDEDEE